MLLVMKKKDNWKYKWVQKENDVIILWNQRRVHEIVGNELGLKGQER